jgi:hypothetical protein
VRRRPSSTRSALVGKRWRLDEPHNLCALKVPSVGRLEQVDASWPGLRQPGDPHRHWKWTEIAHRMSEVFALVREADDATLALFGSKRTRIEVGGAGLLRLDYFEVQPSLLRGDLGGFMAAVVAKRALEAGGEGIALASFVSAEPFYKKLGAAPLAGWNVEKGLVPLQIIGDSLLRLVEVADALEETTQV